MATGASDDANSTPKRKRRSQVYDRELNKSGEKTLEDDDVEIDENIDIFSPEFVRSRVANMPELVELIKDDEVYNHLQKPEVSALMREISLDPNKIPELLDKPEIQFLKKKMEELIKKTYPDAKVPD